MSCQGKCLQGRFSPPPQPRRGKGPATSPKDRSAGNDASVSCVFVYSIICRYGAQCATGVPVCPRTGRRAEKLSRFVKDCAGTLITVNSFCKQAHVWVYFSKLK